MKDLTNYIFPWYYNVSEEPFRKVQDSLINMENEIYTDYFDLFKSIDP